VLKPDVFKNLKLKFVHVLNLFMLIPLIKTSQKNQAWMKVKLEFFVSPHFLANTLIAY